MNIGLVEIACMAMPIVRESPVVSAAAVSSVSAGSVVTASSVVPQPAMQPTMMAAAMTSARIFFICLSSLI